MKMSTDKESDEVCCDSREMRVEGWDAGDGYHTPVVLEQNEHGRWNLVAPEWFSVDVQFCPWCGKELPKPEPFEIGEDRIKEAVAEAVEAAKDEKDVVVVVVEKPKIDVDSATDAEMDALLDDIEAAAKGGAR
jgi:hypothetical protein